MLMLQRFNVNHWWPLTAFPLMILENVSSRGSGAGIAVSSHRGSPLRGTKVSNLYKYFEYIFCNNSGNFWVPLVVVHYSALVYLNLWWRFACTSVFSFSYSFSLCLSLPHPSFRGCAQVFLHACLCTLEAIHCCCDTSFHSACCRIGKLMLFGTIFCCIDSALTIAACLSYKSPFVVPFGKKEQADLQKREFATSNSDHLTVLNAYKVNAVTFMWMSSVCFIKGKCVSVWM
jgi:hypothetical protein